MLGSGKNIVGIILTAESLRVVHVQEAGAAKRVTNVAKKEIAGLSREDQASLMTEALNDLNVKKPAAYAVIPPHLVTTKNIEIPSLDPQEINSIIDLQAGRHTPYSREEILVGYISIGVFQRNYTKVLLLIVRRDMIKEQIDLYESAGVRIEKVLFAPEAIARFYGQALEVKEDDDPVGIINIGHATTDFTIEFNKTAAMYRNIPFGLSHIVKEGPPARDKLVDELVKSIESYQNEDINKMPATYILTSDDAKIKELQPVFEEKFKTTVKIMPYLDLIEAPQPVMLKLVSEYSDDSFLDVVAAATCLGGVQVDLTPDEIKTKRQIEEKGREVVKLGIGVLAILILVCATFFSKIYFRGIALTKLKEDFRTYHQKVMVLDRVAQKTRIIKGYINGRMTVLDTIQELYALIPDEIYLENILIDENGHIQIRGVSESMSRVFNFVSALEDSMLFKSVKTTSTTAKKDRGKDAAAFEIAFSLESAKDEVPQEEEAAAPHEEAEE